MRLGKDTGSLANYVYGNSGSPEPKIGMGCTQLLWSDRNACTIIAIDSKGMLTVTRDNTKRMDKNGMSESQEYEYTTNPEGHKYFYKKDKTGRYRQYVWNEETNRYNKLSHGTGLTVGHREEYYDYSF